MKHGTRSAYVNLRCRCELCSEAQRAYQAARKDALLASSGDKRHGTSQGYKLGCRCDGCSSAHGQWTAEYRARRIESGEFTHGTGSGYQIFGCRCLECRAWMAGHARAAWLKKIYKITVAEYQAMMIQQDGKCASCKSDFVDSYSTHVDHDHDTGKVRALLCRGCNIALGLLREDPAAIRALANYIETHRTTPCAQHGNR